MTSDLVLRSTRDRVTTLTLNQPARLNGWTRPMLEALRSALAEVAADPGTAAVVLTGTDPYYCAGVNLSETIGVQHPRVLRATIAEHNRLLFELFLAFPKPIVAAVNGPAIGASVTSAVLCDAIVASERATFATPFAALAVPAEGCSSVTFPRLMGEVAAARMLGPEGWKPTGAEAHAVGLVDRVVPHEALHEEAVRLASGWVAAGAARTPRGGFTRAELDVVNAAESERVADAFLASPFLHGQASFLWRKRKRRAALVFFGLWATRPAWSLLL